MTCNLMINCPYFAAKWSGPTKKRHVVWKEDNEESVTRKLICFAAEVNIPNLESHIAILEKP